MNFIKTVMQILVMFFVAILISGIILTVNRTRNILETQIRGTKYHFVSAEYGADYKNEFLPGTVKKVLFGSEDGGTLQIEVTKDYFYNPCDTYLVSVTRQDAKSAVYTYTPDEKAIAITKAALNKIENDSTDASVSSKIFGTYQEPAAEEMAQLRSMTFLFGEKDLDGYILNAVVTDTNSSDSFENQIPLVLTGGDGESNLGEMDLPEWASFALDSITAFRNYKPWFSAMRPAWVLAPMIILTQYVILAMINMSRDFYKKRKYQKEMKAPIFRRTE